MQPMNRNLFAELLPLCKGGFINVSNTFFTWFIERKFKILTHISSLFDSGEG